MPAKKNNYISTELDWAEEQLVTWKAYIDANPLHTLKDRLSYKETRGGGMIPMVVSSIEQQGKFVQDTMKNYLSLLEIVDKLRQAEITKMEARGGKTINGGMMGKLAQEGTQEQ